MKELRRYYDSRTGFSYNVNVRTGIVCRTDGEYPDAETHDRILRAVQSRMKAQRGARERDQMLRDCGLVKVRGNLGGTYWE